MKDGEYLLVIIIVVIILLLLFYPMTPRENLKDSDSQYVKHLNPYVMGAMNMNRGFNPDRRWESFTAKTPTGVFYEVGDIQLAKRVWAGM